MWSLDYCESPRQEKNPLLKARNHLGLRTFVSRDSQDNTFSLRRIFSLLFFFAQNKSDMTSNLSSELRKYYVDFNGPLYKYPLSIVLASITDGSVGTYLDLYLNNIPFGRSEAAQKMHH